MKIDQSGDAMQAAASALDHAEAICRRRGARLTSLRREVLGMVLDSPRPVSAYELLDGLRAHRKGAAPPTVYRALGFLQAHGLVHKVERLAAYIGCATPDPHEHAAQFLICRICGRATEIEDEGVTDALAHAARRVGFRLGGATIEAEGICSPCAASLQEKTR